MSDTYPMRVLRHHVSGKVERGEAEPIVAVEMTPQEWEEYGSDMTDAACEAARY